MTAITQTQSQALTFTAGLKRTANAAHFNNKVNEALTCLETLNFPNSKVEAWKYTRLGKITNQSYATCNELITADINKIAGLNAYYLVFVNGVFDEKQSDDISENGVSIEVFSRDYCELAKDYFSQQTNNHEIFTAINTSFINNGVFISVTKNTVVSKPIVIINKSTSGNFLTNFRNVFTVAESAQAHVIQLFDGDNTSQGLTNIVSEITVADNANLTYDKWQNEALEHNHVSRDIVNQAKDAVFTTNTITTGGLLTRNDLLIHVNGQNGLTNLNGLYISKKNQHIDNHTTVDHKVPHCESHELYKGIVDDNSTAVFNGKVFVRPDAQKTNAFQQNANIVMTDEATVNSKPELEIYADDVKCSHGSVTGQFDEEAVFYLRARGIGEESARNLLVHAFASDVLNKITLDPLRETIETFITNNFSWGK